MYRVLLVDDEIINYQLFEKLVKWEEKGFEIVGTASDGLEALQQYEQLEPDLIFMDIQLPLMDGLECVRCIREADKKVQIVIVSAYGDFSYAQKAIRYGVQDFLLKPVSRLMLNQLVDKMRETLDKNSLEQSEGENGIDVFSNEKTRSLTQLIKEDGNGYEEYQELLRKNEICGLMIIDDAGNLVSADRWKELMNHLIQIKPVGKILQGIVQSSTGHTLMCWEKDTFTEEISRQILEFFIDGRYKVQIYIKYEADELGEWIRRLLNSENYGFYEENSGVYRLGDVEYSHREMNTQEISARIAKAFVDNSPDQVLQWIEERFEEAKKEKISPVTLKDFSLDVLVRIKFALKKFDQQGSFLLMRNVRVENVHKMQDAGRLLDFLVEKIKDTFMDLEKCMVNQGRSLVFAANAFTELYYCDVDFSVQKVADHIGISKNYFTSQYKEQSGTGFWEYVTTLRMEKAKEYLITTEEAVGNIGRDG
ncbi:MAG: response regulator, partial [Clostridia bacterium]|nr:response regulator [Clostridia bacterium]